MRSAFLLIESVRLIYLMISVNSAPALNLTDLRAGISIGCLVFGLTPLRADFSATEKEPKPKRATLPPSFNSLDTVSTKASTAFFASTLLKTYLSDIDVINYVLFMIV